MSDGAESTATHVRSADGTEIAVFVSGRGQPLVVVPGTASDHTTWRFVLPYLEGQFAVHAMDRRGRGESGDTADYSIAKEYADVAAVLDAAATETGSPVDLLGHSFGGNIAFGVAMLDTNIRKLVLYEGWPTPDITHRALPPDVMARLSSLLAQDQPAAMLETFYREIAMLSEQQITGLKAAPTWPARVSAAGTVPRELLAFSHQAFDPAGAARIRVPVLLLVGADSPVEIKADPEIVAAALPDARIKVLEHQTHLAHFDDPETFAGEVIAFLQGDERD